VFASSCPDLRAGGFRLGASAGFRRVLFLSFFAQPPSFWGLPEHVVRCPPRGAIEPYGARLVLLVLLGAAT
jgi:hypothetical protein